jgi:hypothetical protein
MAPRSEETTLMPTPEEEPTSTDDSLVAKPLTDACGTMSAPSTTMCTDFFGSIFGKRKECNHCKQRLVNSDERIKEMQGETKIYYHPECKVEREARMEQHKAVMTELKRFFVIKAELIRRAQLEAFETESVDEVVETKKTGMLSKIFSMCRNKTAVEV